MIQEILIQFLTSLSRAYEELKLPEYSYFEFKNWTCLSRAYEELKQYQSKRSNSIVGKFIACL